MVMVFLNLVFGAAAIELPDIRFNLFGPARWPLCLNKSAIPLNQ